MDPAITVAIVASIPSSLAVVIGLLNRRQLGGKTDEVREHISGKNGVMAEIRANTEKIDAFRVWTEKHDMDHLITAHDEQENLKRRLDRLEGIE